MSQEQVIQLKCMYSQLFNLNEEIKSLVINGRIDDAVMKSSMIDNLMKQIKFARLGMAIPEEFKTDIENLESKAVVDIKYTLDSLIKIQENLKNDINKTKNTIKIKNAYTAQLPETGQILYEEE